MMMTSSCRSDSNSDDIDGLLLALGRQHVPNEWRLFIDSSKCGLKEVLLHNSNTLPSIPLLLAPDMKETYESMEKVTTVFFRV